LQGFRQKPFKTAGEIRAEILALSQVIKDAALKHAITKDTIPEVEGHLRHALKDLENARLLLKGVLSDSVVPLVEYRFFREKYIEAFDRVDRFRANLGERRGVVEGIERNMRWLELKKTILQKLLAKTEDNVVSFPE
jgi:hypothetical protein